MKCRNCYPRSLDYQKVAGKIVVCVNEDPTVLRRIKRLVVQDTKAMGMIHINEDQKDFPFNSGAFPFTEIGNVEGHQILHYINSTR